jgi:nitrate reductase beta subunit
VEKKRMQTAYHKREPSPDIALHEQDLLGGGDEFQLALQQKQMAQQRRQQKRQKTLDDKYAHLTQRREENKVKEEATMEMFRRMAEAKYGK